MCEVIYDNVCKKYFYIIDQYEIVLNAERLLLPHFNFNGSYNRLNHVEIVVRYHVIDMIYQLILLNIIVNHVTTKCYM